MILERMFTNDGSCSSPYGVREGQVGRNVHERVLPGTMADSAELLDALAEPGSSVWPSDRWPALRLANGMRSGSSGGHGPIRYSVSEYEPGKRVRFVTDGGAPICGWHEFSITQAPGAGVVWRHELVVEPATATFHAMIEPLHDALLEDLFDGATARLASTPLQRHPLSRGVRLRRSVLQAVDRVRASRKTAARGAGRRRVSIPRRAHL